MVRAVERKVRSRAQQLYESRGQAEGQELQDWFQAETEILENTPVAKLYRRMRDSSTEGTESHHSQELAIQQTATCETSA